MTPLPARRLIEAGVPVAVATDFNPGIGAELSPAAGDDRSPAPCSG